MGEQASEWVGWSRLQGRAGVKRAPSGNAMIWANMPLCLRSEQVGPAQIGPSVFFSFSTVRDDRANPDRNSPCLGCIAAPAHRHTQNMQNPSSHDDVHLLLLLLTSNTNGPRKTRFRKINKRSR